jgi:hypothetical protein
MQVILFVLAFPLACSFLLMPQGGGMRRDDLMKSDLLSEALLLGSGIAIMMVFVMIVVAAFARAAALR